MVAMDFEVDQEKRNYRVGAIKVKLGRSYVSYFYDDSCLLFRDNLTLSW